MKKLVKMKLINWHLFNNETFEIKNNTVITGENGSGKSTLLDALQYVLTAGKAKFNGAANDSGKRTIESYIRGKLGREGKEYLRNGEVISYIVLEYYDETSQKSQLIGVVLELNQANVKKEMFFHIHNHQMEDSLFINNKHIYNRSEFKRNLKALNIAFDEVDNHKSAVPTLLRQALGVTTKYFEMIPRALAFKPINQVYNFIFDFLLNEDPVKIDDLRDNVRAYRNLGNVLKEQEKRLESLEKIDEFYTLYEKNYENQKNHEYARDVLYIEGLIYEKNKLEQVIEKDKHQVQDLKRQLEILDHEKEKLQKDILSIENTLDNNEGYKLQKELENQLSHKKESIQRIKNIYKGYVQKLANEVLILKQLRLKEKFIQDIQNNQYDTEYLNDNLFDIKNDLAMKKNDYNNQEYHLKHHLEELRKEYNGYVENYKLLQQNRFSYRKEVNQLLNILRDKLSKTYQRKVEVRPLCEYLEIKDESWRDAVEGYLNTQRFDIIIDPEYYQEASRIYNQYKDSHGIYGVGIVDVVKLAKYQNEKEGSLSAHVTSLNSYAKQYANMLLNSVVCVEHVDDLRQYQTSITKECMLYKNYTIRAIRPEIFKKPYIGLDALKIQKQQIEDILSELDNEIKTKKHQYQDVKKVIEILDKSQIEILTNQTYIIDEYRNLDSQVNDLQERINELKHDDSILALLEQKDKIDKQYQEKLNEYDFKQNQKSDLSSSINNNIETCSEITKQLEILPPIPETIDNNVLEIKKRYYKRYFHQYQTINNVISNRIKELTNASQKEQNNVEYAMKAFNHEFKVGYDESIESIEIYRKLFYKLRDIEIIKRQEDVRNARRKCEQTFQESFISRLNEKITQAKKDIKELNIGLADKNFNGDSYEFEVNPSKRKEYRKYYDIIMTNQQYDSDNLFVTTLSHENRMIMDELFNQISLLGEDESSEKLLQKYTDYREYLDYDIKISHENGDITKFSKVNREKSGGETQTPFYVVIASSFEQMIKNRLNEDSGCVVLFDEAFNNMDETRIQAMMKFYNELNVQIILAVPPTRASTIMPYVDTTLAIIKSGDASFVEAIIHE